MLPRVVHAPTIVNQRRRSQYQHGSRMHLRVVEPPVLSTHRERVAAHSAVEAPTDGWRRRIGVAAHNAKEQTDVRRSRDASSPVHSAPVARSASPARILRFLAYLAVAFLRHAERRWASGPRAARPTGGRQQYQRAPELPQCARLQRAWLEAGAQLRSAPQPRAQHAGAYRGAVRAL